MSQESLYWTLSTLPQVCAALIAFIGFLALDSLSETTARRNQLESDIREFIERHATITSGPLASLKKTDIHNLPGNKLMIYVDQYGGKVGNVDVTNLLDNWKPLNVHIAQMQRVLAIFVGWNLVLILASLLLLPFVSRLSNFAGFSTAFIIAVVSSVGGTAVMIYKALSLPRL